jgi:O-antigen/teichoic acid export membrane protein
VKQAAWALVDQVLSSGTNFAMAIVVARLLAPAAYGSFSLAMASWLVLLGLVRSGIVQPYVVEASQLDDASWRTSTRQAGGAVLAFGLLGGAVLSVVGLALGLGTPTGQAYVTLGFLATPLVVQDFWRYVAFSRQQPRKAVLNDTVWAAVQGPALLVLLVGHHRTLPVAMTAWGAGAIAGAWVGVLQFQVAPSLRLATVRWTRGIARLGGWFGLANSLYTGSAQLVAIVVAAGAGRADLGGLRAVQNLLGPAQLVAMSGDSVALPSASREYGSNGSRALTTFAAQYGLLLNALLGGLGVVTILCRRPLVRVLLGSHFLGYSSLVVPLTVGLVATAWALSASVALRALRAGRQLAQAEAAGAAAKVVCVWALLSRFGVTGAAWGVTVGSLLHAGAMWAMYAIVVRGTHERARAAGPPLGLGLPAHEAGAGLGQQCQ